MAPDTVRCRKYVQYQYFWAVVTFRCLVYNHHNSRPCILANTCIVAPCYCYWTFGGWNTMAIAPSLHSLAYTFQEPLAFLDVGYNSLPVLKLFLWWSRAICLDKFLQNAYANFHIWVKTPFFVRCHYTLEIHWASHNSFLSICTRTHTYIRFTLLYGLIGRLLCGERSTEHGYHTKNVFIFFFYWKHVYSKRLRRTQSLRGMNIEIHRKKANGGLFLCLVNNCVNFGI